MASITSARTDAYKGKNTKSDYNISDKVGKAIDARAQKRKLCLRKQRLIKVPIPVYFTTSIQCELDKFYEEVNAMQQQFGQQQHQQHSNSGSNSNQPILLVWAVVEEKDVVQN